MPGRVPGILFAALYSAFQHGLGVQGHAVAADSKWRWGSSAASKGTAVTTPSCWPMVTTSPGFTKKFSPTPQ